MSKISDILRLEKAQEAQASRARCDRSVYSSLLHTADWRAGTNTLLQDQFLSVDDEPIPYPQLAKFGENGWVMHYKQDTGYTLHHVEGNVRLESMADIPQNPNVGKSPTELLEKASKKSKKDKKPESEQS